MKHLTIDLNGLTDAEREKALQLARALSGSPCVDTYANYFVGISNDVKYPFVIKGEMTIETNQITFLTSSLVLSWGLAVEYGLCVVIDVYGGFRSENLSDNFCETVKLMRSKQETIMTLNLEYYARGAIKGVSVEEDK